jgi:glutaryl-CoA dehydrogenase
VSASSWERRRRLALSLVACPGRRQAFPSDDRLGNRKRVRLPGGAERRRLSAAVRTEGLMTRAASTSTPVAEPIPLREAEDFLGLDGQLSEEERAGREMVRTFCERRLRADLPGWYEQGLRRETARELMAGFGELGLLGMHLRGYGCAGAGAVAYGLACLELEATDSGFRSMVSVQGSLAMSTIHRYGSEEQKQAWLPGMAKGETVGCFGLTEPDSGSDPSSMRTVARRDGDDWVLSGTKMWITNGGVADVAVVWARTDDGIRGFLVPAGTKGFAANDIHQKLSLRASITSELVLDEVRLPTDAMLPAARGLGAPLASLNEARFGIVFGALGAARDAFTCALDYARTREQFGQPIGGFQLTQAKLVEMLLELQKGTLLALQLGRLKEAGRLRPEQLSLGKLNNVRAALEICRTARTILGASGVTLEYPVLRHMSNLESVLTYEGTSEVHTLIVGQALTGQNAFR